MNDLQHLKSLLNNNIEKILSSLNQEYEILGDNIYSTCPVHNDSDNPRAFCFSKNRGMWKCWTRDCQNEYKNDVFGLIQGALSAQTGKQATFKDALIWGKNLVNVTKNITKQENNQTVDESWHNITSILLDNTECKSNSVISIDENIAYPSKYFITRGFQKRTLDHFGIGDCIDKNSKLFDRAIIPIHDQNGNMVAIIARSIKEYKDPKFIIHPKGVNKSCLLYNHHRAIESVTQSHTVFIVEGQGDVWRLYEAGIYNAVGIFGKTISKDQEKMLNSMPITHMVILTDNDQAGREAKIQIKRQFSRMYRLSFPVFKKKDVGDMQINEIKDVILGQIKGFAI